MTHNGSKILVEALKRQNVEYIFGYPGGAILPVLDAIYNETSFRFVLPRHEQAAGHAADGYARATGKVGVCLVTSGPGMTNLTTALATAYMDSAPIVALTGQVKTSLIGNDAFQEVDTTGITNAITKHNYLIERASDIPRVIAEAFYIALSGRPGPVVIDLPVDIMSAHAKYDYDKSPEMELPGYHPEKTLSDEDVETVMRSIHSSQRPLFYVGGGVVSANAGEILTAVARKLGVPVTTTLNGLGSFPSSDPLSLGMLGMHGTVYANTAVQECDLLISIGARFDDRVTGKLDEFAPKAEIIHIDIDPTSINKSVRVDYSVVCNARVFLEKLFEIAYEQDIRPWTQKLSEIKKSNPLWCQNNGVLKPQKILRAIEEVVNGNAIIVTDVGQHQMWAAQWIGYEKPRTFISSGGLGTMGFGLPAALGAQIGVPEKKVILITGDGSLQMNIQELQTCSSLGIPIKIFVMNNGYLGMVRQWQELFYEKRYSQTDLAASNPDFVRVGKAFGIKSEKIESSEGLVTKVRKLLMAEGPILADFRIEREENVFPMVPSGKPLSQMIGGLA